MAEKITCTKCGRARNEIDFFKIRGERYPMCKDCLTQNIDNTKPETFMWILEMFDVPYVETQWIALTNSIYKKKGKLTPKSVLGTYLRTVINLSQYKNAHYADSDRINYASQKARQEAEAAAANREAEEAELKRKLEAGEITQQEYNTRSYTTQPAAMKAFGNTFIMPTEPDNSALLEQLTDEDYQYLNIKWGTVYRPDQWVTMETMYNRYSNEYEMTVDREEVLKKMCKTSLKMDEYLDAGDVASYQKLSSVFDALRKSGKFTEAQNKEKEEKYLDTIGELVRLCEEAEGPIINELPDPDEYPQDNIDYTIKDLKAYNFSLFAGEPHIQDMIETFIKRYEDAEAAQKKLEDEKFILSQEDLIADALTDKEAADWDQFIEDQIEADLQNASLEGGLDES